MGLREVLQRNQAVVIVLGAAVIIGSVYWIVQGQGGSRALPDQVYFYDLASNQLYPVARTTQPPVPAPSGGEGVKAIAYGCGGCAGGTPQVAYLITNDDKGQMVALPPGGEAGAVEWHDINAPQGMAITDRMRDICKDQPASECFPS